VKQIRSRYNTSGAVHGEKDGNTVSGDVHVSTLFIQKFRKSRIQKYPEIPRNAHKYPAVLTGTH
jgi:hypothetical protein